MKKTLLNAGQFDVHACHDMRLIDHMTLNFNNNWSYACSILGYLKIL